MCQKLNNFFGMRRSVFRVKANQSINQTKQESMKFDCALHLNFCVSSPMKTGTHQIFGRNFFEQTKSLSACGLGFIVIFNLASPHPCSLKGLKNTWHLNKNVLDNPKWDEPLKLVSNVNDPYECYSDNFLDNFLDNCLRSLMAASGGRRRSAQFLHS